MSSPASKPLPRALIWASALVPVLVMGAVLYLLFTRGTGLQLTSPAPIEKLEFERVVLRPGQILAHVINTGPEPVTIAQGAARRARTPASRSAPVK